MKISVVVTVYNLEKYVAEALQSVFNQTRKADEIIVIDDCSTDRTQEILESFVDKITYIRLEKNSGAIFNSLTGVRHATGDVLCMLDGDDIWAENKLEVVEKNFLEDSKLVLLSHHHIRVNQKLEPLNIFDDTNANIQRILNISSDKVEQSNLLKESILEQTGYWLGSAYSFRRDKFDIKLFEKIINSYENARYTYLDLIIGTFLVLNNPDGVVGYTSETLFYYRIHPYQTSVPGGIKPSVESLFKAILVSKSNSELIYKEMEICGASQKILERRRLLTEHYDYLSDLYNGKSIQALKLFVKLSRTVWTYKTTVKELKRLVFVSVFGVSYFLKFVRN